MSIDKQASKRVHTHSLLTHDESRGVTHDGHVVGNHEHVATFSAEEVGAQQKSKRVALMWAAGLTGGFALVEVFGGFWSGSLALLSDAGHMLTDSVSLWLAVLMAVVARRPANQKMSFGFGRAEAVGAFVNGLFMLGIISFIVVEALRRFWQPEAVNGNGVMVIAGIGLILNIVIAWKLSSGHQDLNSKAALVHVMGDLLGSVAAIVSGAVIYYVGWLWIDPILSLLVAVLLIKSTVHILKQSLVVLMEGVPDHLSLADVGDRLHKVDGVQAIHDLHIWYMSSDHVALSAHVHVDRARDWPIILSRIQKTLASEFDIQHVTLQPEWRLDGESLSEDLV